MSHRIPDHLSKFRNFIEKQYKTDETFRDVYNDYLDCLDACKFWLHNPADIAHARLREYAKLVTELEEEVIQILKIGTY